MSKINRSYIGTRYPHKLNCDHMICNICMDDHNGIRNNSYSCPICKKPLLNLPKNSLTGLIDFEQFGRATFYSLLSIQNRMQNEISQMNTVYANHINQKCIQSEFDRFILKCSYCPERFQSEKEKANCSHHLDSSSILNSTEIYQNDEITEPLPAQYLCFICYSIYCLKCYDFKHSGLNHIKSELEQPTLNELPCSEQNHKRNSVFGYCYDCRTFVCSDCAIKYDHKRHKLAILFTSTDRNEFFKEFIGKFNTIRNLNQYNLEKIDQELKRLMPDDVSIHMIEKHLFRNSFIEIFSKLRDKKSQLEQAIFIIDELLKIMNVYLNNKCNLMLRQNGKDTDTFKYLLNQYARLTTFDESNFHFLGNVKNLVSIENIQNEEASVNDQESNQSLIVDQNNNIESVNSNKTFHGLKSNQNQNSNRALCMARSRSFQSSIQSIFEKNIKPLKPIAPLIEQKSELIIEKLENNIKNNYLSRLSLTQSSLNLEEKLEVDGEYTGKLLSFNSPADFYFRLDSQNRFYSNMAKKMDILYPIDGTNDYLDELEFNNLHIGCNVAHLITLPTIGKKWVRARVTKIHPVNGDSNEKKASVFCYDWGINEEVDARKIKRLFTNLSNAPPAALHCNIHNLIPFSGRKNTDNSDNSELNGKSIKNWNDVKWKSTHSTHVLNWSRNRTLRLKAYSISDSNHYGVDLLDNTYEEMTKNSNKFLADLAYSYKIESITLSEMLVRCKMCKFETDPPFFKLTRLNNCDMPQFVPMKPLSFGEKTQAGIGIFDKIEDFTMKRLYPETDCEDSFSKLDQRMQDEYSCPEASSYLQIFEPFVGMAVAAVFINDKRWYRGEIIEIIPNRSSAVVYFVDFGNNETCSLSNLRYLPKEFFINEVAIFRCKLFGIKYTDQIKAQDYFVKAISNLSYKAINVHVKEIVDEGSSKTVSVKTSKIHEVIIRYPIDTKITNLNVLLTKFGYAEPTNSSIFDGEQESTNIIKENSVTMPARLPEPSNLDKEVIEVSKMPNKIIKHDDKKVLCKVTNAISPNEIWVQDAVDSENYYEKFQIFLNEKYAEIKELKYLNRQEWKVGDLCILKPMRKNCYLRAKIVEKFPTGNFRLICLDTGNYESNVKSENLYELIDDFRGEKLEFKAKKCCLIGVQPTGTQNGTWSSLAKTYTSETLNDNFVHVSFKSEIKNDDSIDTAIYIDANKKPLNSSISSEHEESFIRFAEMLNAKGLALLTEKSSSLVNLVKNPIFKTAAILTGLYDPKTYLDVIIPQELKDDRREIKIYDCVVTNVDVKTGHIFFRFLSPVQKFDSTKKIQNDLQNFFNSKTAESDYYFSYNFIRDCLKKSIRLACVCQHKDRKFYRCEIISESPEKDNNIAKKFLVLFIDYGYVTYVTLDAIFRPFISHLSIERQVFTFKLKPNIEKHAKQNFLQFLSSMLRNKLVDLEIEAMVKDKYQIIIGDLKIKNLNLWISDFLLNNKSITESFSNQEYSPMFPQNSLPGNSFNTPHQVSVAFHEEYNILWLQFEPNRIAEMHEEFMQLKESKSLKNLKLEKIEENRSCLCMYHFDKSLYRATILDANYPEGIAKVLYVDFGNTDEIEFQHIYELDSKYFEIEKQAVRCKLKNVFLDQSSFANQEEFKEEIISEISECFETEEKLYALFSKVKQSSNQKELEVEIYINNPHDSPNACLAYQSLIDKNRIEIGSD